MKHSLTLIAIALLGLHTAAQENVMQHIPPEQATAMHNYWGQTQQGVPLWGYYLGHNVFGDEAFGERYEISGSNSVVGVIAYLGGTSVSNTTATYSVHNVGTAPPQMPGPAIASKSFQLGSAPTDGQTPHMIMFDAPASVQDSFFVTLDLGDYSHDPLVGDTICLMSGEHDSRPASDDTFGRNVVRKHSHAPTPAWKDFHTQNFTPVSTYFAIYPIMSAAVGILEMGLGAMTMDLYPVPMANELNIALDLHEDLPFRVLLFGMDGRLLHTEQFATGRDVVQLNVSGLVAGTYVVAIEQGRSRIARMVAKS